MDRDLHLSGCGRVAERSPNLPNVEAGRRWQSLAAGPLPGGLLRSEGDGRGVPSGGSSGWARRVGVLRDFGG